MIQQHRRVEDDRLDLAVLQQGIGIVNPVHLDVRAMLTTTTAIASRRLRKARDSPRTPYSCVATVASDHHNAFQMPGR